MKKRAYCGNRPAKLRFLIIDFFVDIISSIFGRKKNENDIIPQDILLFNYGHLGDMLMMGYMVNALKIKHPSVKIHLVAGRWCKVLIENNPLYDEIFYLNHVQTNREPITYLRKYFHYFRDIFTLIKRLKKERYSHSFDFRYSANNANQILPFLNIKQKNGFGTRGLGGLLDKEYFLLQNGTHTIDVQSQGLKNIGVEINSKYVQPFLGTVFIDETPINPMSKFLIIFPETGNPDRMITIDFWKKIIDLLITQNIDYQMIMCGVTEFNHQLFNDLAVKYPNKFINATNILKIPQIISLLKKSEGAITLDSFPAHIASTLTKTLCLFKNGYGTEYLPINSFPVQIIHNHHFSKNATNFRENMTINYVESFDNQAFMDILNSSINEFFVRNKTK